MEMTPELRKLFPEPSTFMEALSAVTNILGTGLAMSPAPALKILGGLSLGTGHVLGGAQERRREALGQLANVSQAIQMAGDSMTPEQLAPLLEAGTLAASRRTATPNFVNRLATLAERVPVIEQYRQAGIPIPPVTSTVDLLKGLRTQQQFKSLSPEQQELVRPFVQQGSIFEGSTMQDLLEKIAKGKREEATERRAAETYGYGVGQRGTLEERAAAEEARKRAAEGRNVAEEQRKVEEFASGRSRKPSITKEDIRLISQGVKVPGLDFIPQETAAVIAKEYAGDSPTMWATLLKQQGVNVPGFDYITPESAKAAVEAYQSIQKQPVSVFQYDPVTGAITQASGPSADMPGALGAMTVERERGVALKTYRVAMNTLSRVDNLITRIDPSNTGFIARLGSNIRMLGRDFPQQAGYLFNRREEALADLKRTNADPAWIKAFQDATKEEAPTIDTLTLLLAYDVARSSDPGGRLSQQDFDVNSQASGYRRATAEDTVLRMIGVRERLVDDIVNSASFLNIDVPEHVKRTPLPRGVIPEKGKVYKVPK